MRPRRTFRLLAGLVAVVVALALSTVPASAAFPGANGKLAFGKPQGVYTVWANGDGQRLAIPNAVHAVWSPDGRRIAFQRAGTDGFSHIWVKDMVTGGLTQITTNPRYDDYPAWSPDGTKIAFVSFAGETRAWGGIWYIKATRPFGSRVLVLPPKPETWGSHLAWSPDGTQIAFTYYVTGFGDNIAVMPVGSPYSEPTILTSDGPDDYPTWSPSGRQIAYTSYGWLSIMNADGTGQVHYNNNESSMSGLAWSPNGQKIAAIINWQYSKQVITLNPWTGAWIDEEIAWGVYGSMGLDWQPIPR